MSSTERAPEPTMEEILASIRRIITDDEGSQAKAGQPAQKAQAEEENLEGEADNQIIDDIARVLSGSGNSEAPANEEEEILDLAGELGGLELVEDDAEPVFEVTQTTEVVEVLELEDAEPAEPEAAPVFQMTDEAPAEEPQQEEEPPQEQEPEPAPEPEMAPPPPPQMSAPEMPVPPPAAEPVPDQPKPSASEAAASALERAIAALRAGQAPASTTPPAEPFQFQAAPQPEAMASSEPQAEPEPIPMAVLMPEPEPEPETHPEPEAHFEPDASFEPEPDATPVDETPVEEGMADSEDEPELVLLEESAELLEIEEPQKPPFWPAQASEERSEPAPEAGAAFEPESVFTPEPASQPAPEPVAVHTNGVSHHAEGPSRTLEDSIKDMLRPMLREWLDDNMPRIIRDELDADSLRRHQD